MDVPTPPTAAASTAPAPLPPVAVRPGPSPGPGSGPGVPTVLAQVADLNQLPQGLVFAAEQYLLAAEQRAAQGATAFDQAGAPRQEVQKSGQAMQSHLPTTPPTGPPGISTGTGSGPTRQVSAAVQTGPPTAASAGVQAGGGLQSSMHEPLPQPFAGPPRPLAPPRPPLILPRPPTPRSVGVPTASPRFFLPSGAAVTVTTTHGSQPGRHLGQPRTGAASSTNGNHPTVFRIELNPHGLSRPPPLSPLGTHPPSGTPGGSSQQWGSAVVTPLGSSASSNPTPGQMAHPGFGPQGPTQPAPTGGLAGMFPSPMAHGQPGDWSAGAELSDGAARQSGVTDMLPGLYSPLSSPYGPPTPRDFKIPRGGSILRARGRGRGRGGRGRRGGDDNGFFGQALSPGFLLASTNAIQEAVQRTVAGMTPDQIRQMARLYGVTGDHVDIPSPNSVVSHMVSVFSNTADGAVRREGQPPSAAPAPVVLEEGRVQHVGPRVEAGKKDEGAQEESGDAKIGADVEQFVSEALVEPKGAEEGPTEGPNLTDNPPTQTTPEGVLSGGAQTTSASGPSNGGIPAAAPAAAAQPPPAVNAMQNTASAAQGRVQPASALPGGAGQAMGGVATGVTDAARAQPKPTVQVPTSLPEPADNLTPRTVLSDRAPTPPSTGGYVGSPELRPRGDGESAVDAMFPASRFVVQEAMQKAVQGIQQDHSAVMGRAMMAGNLGLVQAAVATAEARLTAVFNIAVKEIAEQIGREAAARVVSAENRAAQAERMLKDTKEQAMGMIKRIQDSFQKRLSQVEARAALDLKKALKKKRPRPPDNPPMAFNATDAAAEGGNMIGAEEGFRFAVDPPNQPGMRAREGGGSFVERTAQIGTPALLDSPSGALRKALAAAAPQPSPSAAPRRKQRPLPEDEPISKLRKLLSSRAKPLQPRPRPRPPRPGLEILRQEPNLGLLSVVAEVMDSEDEGPTQKEPAVRKPDSGSRPGKSTGQKTGKGGEKRSGNAAQTKSGGKKAVTNKSQPVTPGGSRVAGMGLRDAPSDTESDEETVPIARRGKKLVSADSVLKSGVRVRKQGARSNAAAADENTPVVRLNKLPLGLEKAIAARAAGKEGKQSGREAEHSKKKGEGQKKKRKKQGADRGGETTVVEVMMDDADDDDREEEEQAETSSPRTTRTKTNTSPRNPSKGPPTKASSGASKRPRQPDESAGEPVAKTARTTRQDAGVGRTKSGRKTTSTFVRQSARQQLDKAGDEMDSRNKRRLMQGARQLLAMAKMRR